MLVAIRIRPLSQKEVAVSDYDIIRAEDKLLVNLFKVKNVQIVLDQVEMKCENEGKKPEMLHRSKEQRYYFDRIFP